MNNIPTYRPLLPMPQERQSIKLPTFSREERERDALNRLANLSGLSATEQRFVSKWRAHGMTNGDRRCFRALCKLQGVRI